MPYGPVTWFKGQAHHFTKKECQKNFLHGPGEWKRRIYACCDCGPPSHEGMTMFIQSSPTMNEWGIRAFFDIKGYDVLNYRFNTDDVLKSSLSGFYKHGYFYNASVQAIDEALTARNVEPLKKWTELNPWDPGVFNLAVCPIYDVRYIPGCTIAPPRPTQLLNPCWSQPSFCMSDASNCKQSFPFLPKTVRNAFSSSLPCCDLHPYIEDCDDDVDDDDDEQFACTKARVEEKFLKFIATHGWLTRSFFILDV